MTSPAGRSTWPAPDTLDRSPVGRLGLPETSVDPLGNPTPAVQVQVFGVIGAVHACSSASEPSPRLSPEG